MEYIALQRSNYLSVDQMNAIYNNFLYLKEKIESQGLSVGEIEDNTVSYDISPAVILEKFNLVEQNIQTIHKALRNGYDDSLNYKEFVWQPYNVDRKNEVVRWLEWFEDMKKIEIISETLTDINGEPITDINGEEIKTYVIRSNENGTI